ncbi:MAG: copper homeostasis protein CutC, partial [Chitinophagaceae bacterium]|nr:copper homeostasis protein CutC [Chitinophagaceae bacterium]
RILTSGQMPAAADGVELIRELIIQADDRIIIMPGSGVRAGNIVKLAESTGATEFHSSARKIKQSKMQHFNASMNERIENINADEEEIKSMIKCLDQYEKNKQH